MKLGAVHKSNQIKSNDNVLCCKKRDYTTRSYICNECYFIIIYYYNIFV